MTRRPAYDKAEFIATAKPMLEAGKNWRHIAEAMGITYKAATERARQCGLTKSQRGDVLGRFDDHDVIRIAKNSVLHGCAKAALMEGVSKDTVYQLLSSRGLSVHRIKQRLRIMRATP